MGVHNLWNLLEPACENISIDHMKGWKVAIDVSMWAHRFNAVRKYRTLNKKADPNVHVELFTRRILKLMHYGILPVFVFDGPAPMLKGNTMKKRKEREEKSFSSIAKKLLLTSKSETGSKHGHNSDMEEIRSKNLWEGETSRVSFCNGKLGKQHEVPPKSRRQVPLGNHFSTLFFSDNDLDEIKTYKEAIRSASQPENFSKKQMGRFMQQISFADEKRSCAENAENSFRVNHVPRSVLLPRTEGSGASLKFRKETVGIVRGKEDTFFYIGPNFAKAESYSKPAPSDSLESKYLSISQDNIERSLMSADMGTTIEEMSSNDAALELPTSASDTTYDNNVDDEHTIDLQASRKILSENILSIEDSIQGHCTAISENARGSEALREDTTSRCHVENPHSCQESNYPPLQEDQWKEIQIEIPAQVTNRSRGQEIAPDDVYSGATQPTQVPRMIQELKSEAENGLLHTGDIRTRDINRTLSDLLSIASLFGIPAVQSPGEAEAQCAALNEKKLVDAVLTEDSDAFLFGAKRVIRGFFDSDKAIPQVFDIEVIELNLGLDRADLIFLAFVLGSDYTAGINGIGRMKCLSFVAAFQDSRVEDIAERVESSLKNVFQTVENSLKSKHHVQCRKRSQKHYNIRLPPSEKHKLVIEPLKEPLPEYEIGPGISTACSPTVTRDVALKSLQWHVASLIPGEKDIKIVFPDLFWHESKLRRSSDTNKVARFDTREMIGAYIDPNIHIPLNNLSWEFPQWSKLRRYIHDRCSSRYASIDINITKLERKYILPVCQCTIITHTSIPSKRLDANWHSLKPGKRDTVSRLRKQFEALRNIRIELKKEAISVHKIAEWTKGLSSF